MYHEEGHVPGHYFNMFELGILLWCGLSSGKVTKLIMDNHNFQWVNQLWMTIFNSHVCLPEGMSLVVQLVWSLLNGTSMHWTKAIWPAQPNHGKFMNGLHSIIICLDLLGWNLFYASLDISKHLYTSLSISIRLWFFVSIEAGFMSTTWSKRVVQTSPGPAGHDSEDEQLESAQSDGMCMIRLFWSWDVDYGGLVNYIWYMMIHDDTWWCMMIYNDILIYIYYIYGIWKLFMIERLTSPLWPQRCTQLVPATLSKSCCPSTCSMFFPWKPYSWMVR